MLKLLIRYDDLNNNKGGLLMISEELLNILACPACKHDVKLEDDKIVCTHCKKRYPIKDNIPIMLVDEAENPSP